jgi:hypothetical protein
MFKYQKSLALMVFKIRGFGLSWLKKYIKIISKELKVVSLYALIFVFVISLIFVMQGTIRINWQRFERGNEGFSSYSFMDEFNGYSNIDFDKSSGARWSSGKFESISTSSKLVSKCFNFLPPKNIQSQNFKQNELSFLEISPFFLSKYHKGNLKLTDCNDKAIFSQDIEKLQNGLNLIDLSFLNEKIDFTKGLRLVFEVAIKNIVFSVITIMPALDSWGLWGKVDDIANIELKTAQEKAEVGKEVSNELKITPKFERLDQSIVEIKIIPNKGDTDIELFEFISREISNRNESAFKNEKNKLYFVLKPIEIGEFFEIDFSLKLKEGLDKNDTFQIEVNQYFGPTLYSLRNSIVNFAQDKNTPKSTTAIKTNSIGDINFQKLSIGLASPPIEIITKNSINLDPYDRYSNLSTTANNLWTTYFIENNGLAFDSESSGDGKNMLFVLDLAKGNCLPFYRGSVVKKLLDNDNFYPLENDYGVRIKTRILKEPEKNKAITKENGQVVVYIENWDWSSIYYGVVVDYDILGGEGCQIGSKTEFVGTIYKSENENLGNIDLRFIDLNNIKNLEMLDTKNREHNILDSQCSLQRYATRDVVRLNQETLRPQDNYWPELRISKEANCYRQDQFPNTETGQIEPALEPNGYVRPGEYVMVNYWMNEGFREQTVDNIDYFYVVNELQAGTSFHGTYLDSSIRVKDGNFYSTRPFEKLNQENVEYFKADLSDKNTVLPDSPSFNHNDPTKSNWKKVTPDLVPLLDEQDLNNPDSAVYYQKGQKMAVLARTKNLEPAWKKDFFLPIFIMRICDGIYNCDAPEMNTEISLNSMQVYSLYKDKCNFCGKTKFGTVKIGEKSYPQILLSSNQKVYKAGKEFSFSINPENLALASSPFNGVWGFDVSSFKDEIDWSSLNLFLSCDNCKVPKGCDLNDLQKTLIINKELGEVTWNLNTLPLCNINTATGFRNENDSCRNTYNQSFVFEMRGRFLNYNFPLKQSKKLKAIAREINNQASDKVPKVGSREVKEIDIILR